MFQRCLSDTTAGWLAIRSPGLRRAAIPRGRHTRAVVRLRTRQRRAWRLQPGLVAKTGRRNGPDRGISHQDIAYLTQVTSVREGMIFLCLSPT